MATVLVEQPKTVGVNDVFLIASEAIRKALEDRDKAQRALDEGEEIPVETQERILEWLRDSAPPQPKKRMKGEFTPENADLPMLEDAISTLQRLAEAAAKARAAKQSVMTLSDPLMFTLETCMMQGAASSKVHVRKAVSSLRLHMAQAQH